MIDFLSNSEWINPQIDFLLLLQTTRTEYFGFLDKIVLSITILGELWLPAIICGIFYWCVDTKAGIYLFSLFGFELFFSQLFKMLACVYRPWVLSNKIHPVELAITAAKGYSFPSGHSSTAASILGGIAFMYRKNKCACILLILTILCVGFSRLWLGVHTPQDVITGLFIGLILVFWINSLINWADQNKNRYFYLLAAVNVFVCLSLIYICYFNQYPNDYVNGKILVDPKYSIYTVINIFGFATGMLNGVFLCRRFLDYDAKLGNLKSKFIRGFIGAILILMLLKFLGGYVFGNLLNYKIAFIITFFIGFFITFIYPLIIKLVQNK